MLDSKTIAALIRQIHHRFPEVAGSQPKVRAHSPPQAKSLPAPASPTYLLTFQGRAEASGGKTIPRWVRVVVSERGKVLKVTTSK